MRIDMTQFGTTLLSRPAGREAFHAARAYVLPQEGTEQIELDFTDVHILAPSWADEFIREVREAYGEDRIVIIEGENASVRATFATLNAT